MSSPQLFSGARAKIQVNGQTIAFCTDVSIDAPQNVRALHAFGSPAPRSVEPLSAGPVTVSIGTVIPVNKPDGSKVNASPEALGLAPVLQQMLTAEDITITLIDKVTNTTYASVKNCRIQNKSMNLSASQLASMRLSFVGIYDSGSSAPGGTQNTPGQLGF